MEYRRDTLWTQQGVTCHAARSSTGFEVCVQIGDFPPFLRKRAHSRADARNQAEFLRVLLDRSREPVPQVRARPPLVLIVEDDPDTLFGYEEMLKLEGFRSASASTLADARRLVREVRPSSVLLDHLLPDGHGASLCAELRRGSGDPLPIVLVTGVDPHQIDLGGFECPDAVLTKPCRPETLTAVIKLLVQGPATSAGAGGQAGGVMRVRCPLCGAPGAQLGARGSFLCQACGKEGVLQWDQFIDGGR